MNFAITIKSYCTEFPRANFGIEQKGMHLNHDFFVVVGKQCRTEMRKKFTNTIYLCKLTNVLLL